MTIENGKIVEATDSELFSYWLKSDWCEIMSYPDYKWRLKDLGCVILESEDNDLIRWA